MRNKRPNKNEEEAIKHLYCDLGYSFRMVCDAMQIKRGSLSGWAKHFLAPRTRSEAQFLANKKGRRDDVCGVKHHNWKGGRHYHQGYILVRLPSSDPFHCMATSYKKRYIFEHRLVMARHLGRPLAKKEFVHHLNGIRDDNRLANLALTTPQNHKTNTLQKHFQRRIRELEEQIAQQRFSLFPFSNPSSTSPFSSLLPVPKNLQSAVVCIELPLSQPNRQ